MKQALLLFAFLTAQTTFGQMISRHFQIDSVQLDQQIFNFTNAIVNVELNEKTASLRIYNNICPQIPGRISCKAMPMLAFNAQYEHQFTKTDGCNIKTHYTKRVEANGDVSYLTIRDYRSMICDMVYLSDYEVTLNLKRDGQKSKSVFRVTEIQ